MEKFHAVIDLNDIVKAEFLLIKNEFFCEIFLSSIGECKNEIYIKKVKEYKSLNKAMASVFFKLPQNEKLSSYIASLPEISMKISNFFETKRNLFCLENISSSSTKIPFYDIIYQNIYDSNLKTTKSLNLSNSKKTLIHENSSSSPKDEPGSLNIKTINPTIKNEDHQKDEPVGSLNIKTINSSMKNEEPPKDEQGSFNIKTINPPIKNEVPEEYLPRTQDISTILNKTQFNDLVKALPPILRLCNWDLKYATMKHGSCFEVLFRLVGDCDYPNILVIKD